MMKKLTFNEHIFRLDISVKEPHLVHKRHSLENLVHYIANMRLREVFVSTLHQLIQVSLHELEDKE